MQKKLIGISGAHGTGKTYTTLQLAQFIKAKHPDLRIGVLMELAAECPGPINLASTEDSQLWIFTAQITRELEMMPHYDIIVCDRTPADTIAYTWHLGFDSLALTMQRLAADHIQRHYQLIIFKSIENNPYCTADGRRMPDNGTRADIETELESVYRRLTLPKGIISYA